VRKPLLILVLFLVGVAILVVLFHVIDFREALEKVAQIGYLGSFFFILNIGVTFLAPGVAWHLLMREEGIPVTLRQSCTSALMGHAFNLITPMMYLGGEPIRTFHVAGVCRVSKRRVLATIIVNKVQELAGLALFLIGGTAVIVVTYGISGPEIVAAAAVGFILLAFLAAVLSLFVGNFKPTVKILDFLIRRKFFPEKLAKTRHKVEEMETLVHEAFVKRWRVFLLSQFLTLLSPLAQFLRPTLFFAMLRWSGAAVDLPSLPDLALLFVLSQVLFILPSTPGGLGVYEGGLVAIFTHVMHWAESDGAAYAILIRTADLLYIAFGVWLVIHYGMTSMLKTVVGAPGAPAISMETREYAPGAAAAPPPAGGDPPGPDAPPPAPGGGPPPA
jgi:uncharacterized protein (TIRG00374 family)